MLRELISVGLTTTCKSSHEELWEILHYASRKGGVQNRSPASYHGGSWRSLSCSPWLHEGSPRDRQEPQRRVFASGPRQALGRISSDSKLMPAMQVSMSQRAGQHELSKAFIKKVSPHHVWLAIVAHLRFCKRLLRRFVLRQRDACGPCGVVSGACKVVLMDNSVRVQVNVTSTRCQRLLRRGTRQS